ncbi:unnamed protein product, partial [Ectocarpus sp. 12 AP-2014]
RQTEEHQHNCCGVTWRLRLRGQRPPSLLSSWPLCSRPGAFGRRGAVAAAAAAGGLLTTPPGSSSLQLVITERCLTCEMRPASGKRTSAGRTTSPRRLCGRKTDG